MDRIAMGNSVGDEAPEDLPPSVEGEPDAGAKALLSLGIPLVSLVGQANIMQRPYLRRE